MPDLQGHRRVRTLLADDSQFMREVLARLIEQEIGFEVVGTAANGLQALRFVADLEPDLVLLDVNMPCMSGLEAARCIKESCHRSDYSPVIVMVTSEDTVECRSLAAEAGASGFVAKSENLRVHLKSTLNILFSGKRKSWPVGLTAASHESHRAGQGHPHLSARPVQLKSRARSGPDAIVRQAGSALESNRQDSAPGVLRTASLIRKR